jgi:hypothetical protein
LIPLSEVPGNEGTIEPAQIVIDVPKLNVGVMFGFTVTVSEVDVAHCPALGVKLYVPGLTLSIVTGLHAPVIPFVDVVGNTGTLPPLQMLNVVPNVNVGVLAGPIVTVKVACAAHCPAEGVNV